MPELEPLWRVAKSLRAVGDQLHERLGVVFVAVFLCHEMDGVRAGTSRARMRRWQARWQGWING